MTMTHIKQFLLHKIYIYCYAKHRINIKIT